MKLDCPDRNQLQFLSSGLLSEEASDQLLGHLEQCDSCQAEIATLDLKEDTFIGRLAGAVRDEANSPDEPTFEHEPDFKNAVAKALGALAGLSPGELASGNLPDSIGEYEIVRPLGQGGMGRVFLGRHTKLGRLVAIKVLAHHRRWDQSMRQRFDSEMRVIGGLNHPNIVTAHDAREVDGVAVLVTEYIEGLDVSDLMRRNGRLKIADACAIGTGVSSALEYVSQKNLVHRDIKPSNVMVDESGKVKLLDLGLARLQATDEQYSEYTATGQALGTADYVSPEQINDAKNVDGRTDLYGLGCTLYKMISGRAPFATTDHRSTFAKMNAHVAEAPQPLSELRADVPAKLESLVHRLLEKSPDRRPQTAAEVAQALSVWSKDANLDDLVKTSLARKPDQYKTVSGLEASSRSGASAKLQTSGSSSKLFWTALAAGLFGMIAGIALGIVITIKQSDGRSTSVTIPEGSTAIIDPMGNITVQLADGGMVGKISQENVSHGMPPEDPNKIMSLEQVTGNNLRKLILGVLNHESAHMHFPAVKNYRGKSKHPFSWRVAILPFIEQMDLYEQYNFDEPWDSEHNKKLLTKMPTEFRDPGWLGDRGNETETRIMAIHGDHGLFGTERPTGFGDISDGSSNTISIMQAHKSVPWTKPEDLLLTDALATEILALMGPNLNLAMGDASVHNVQRQSLNLKLLHEMMTRNGGEPLIAPWDAANKAHLHLNTTPRMPLSSLPVPANRSAEYGDGGLYGGGFDTDGNPGESGMAREESFFTPPIEQNEPEMVEPGIEIDPEDMGGQAPQSQLDMCRLKLSDVKIADFLIAAIAQPDETSVDIMTVAKQDGEKFIRAKLLASNVDEPEWLADQKLDSRIRAEVIVTPEQKSKIEKAQADGLEIELVSHSTEHVFVDMMQSMQGVWVCEDERAEDVVMLIRGAELTIVSPHVISSTKFFLHSGLNHDLELRVIGSGKSFDESFRVQFEETDSPDVCNFRFTSFPNANALPIAYTMEADWRRLEKPETAAQKRVMQAIESRNDIKPIMTVHLVKQSPVQQPENETDDTGFGIPNQTPLDELELEPVPVVTNLDFLEASVTEDSGFVSSLRIELAEEAAVKMGFVTSQNVGRQMAIVLNGKTVMAPKIHSPIYGSLIVSGNLSADELEKLAKEVVREFKIESKPEHQIDFDALIKDWNSVLSKE